MVFMALTLWITAMAFEYKAVTHIPLARKLLVDGLGIPFTDKRIPGAVISLGFSLVLSVELGTVFGAFGLVCMVAGLGSTVTMQPIYWAMRTGRWERLLSDVSSFREQLVTAYKAHKDSIVSTVRSLIALGQFLVKVIWKPISWFITGLAYLGSLAQKL